MGIDSDLKRISSEIKYPFNKKISDEIGIIEGKIKSNGNESENTEDLLKEVKTKIEIYW